MKQTAVEGAHLAHDEKVRFESDCGFKHPSVLLNEVVVDSSKSTCMGVGFQQRLANPCNQPRRSYVDMYQNSHLMHIHKPPNLLLAINLSTFKSPKAKFLIHLVHRCDLFIPFLCGCPIVRSI